MFRINFSSIILFVIVIAFSSKYCYGRRLPSYVQTCSRNDPNLNDCLKKSIVLLKPYLLNGIPEMFIPPITLLEIPEVGFNQNSFNATFKDIKVSNVEEFEIEYIHLDLSRVKLDLKLMFNRIRIKSLFSIDGRLLVLDLKGSGRGDGNFTDVFATISAGGEMYKSNGKDYIRWISKKIDLDIRKPELHFEGLFGNNTELVQQANKIINDNVDELVNELKPSIKTVVTDYIFTTVNRIFQKYSFDELFPN